MAQQKSGRGLVGRAVLLAAFYTVLVATAAEPVPTRPLRDLNTNEFSFTQVADKSAWKARRMEVRNRVLLAAGLLPIPERTPLNAVVHGRIDRDDYTVEKVFFESLPGNFVTGNLYLPKKHGDKIPGILCPHGHWPGGRFMQAADADVKKQLASGAERLENAARSPLQARCVQLARMGCAVFHYDMLGYADNVQFCDDTGKPGHRHGTQAKGFMSPEAELNLCGYFPLQTWNSVRALDFILSLPFVDEKRIGCTGASGGGTQTMIISGIDDRIAAAFPCVMVSVAMQGGCTCENSDYLRIGQGNIDIAALTAPRPLGMTAADDWTKQLATKGFPDLQHVYAMLGVPDRVEAHFNTQFPHNYNAVSRAQMYRFYNKYFALGLREEQLNERDFLLASQQELSVWGDQHPAPCGDKVGTPHEIAVINWFKQQNEGKISSKLQRTAWEIMVGYKLPPKGVVTFADGAVRYGSNTVEATVIYPEKWNKTTVLWLSLKSDAPPRQLLNAGYAIACPKLYLPGATKNPNIYGARKQPYEGFAGYHYGYNRPLFAERVGDALAVLAMLRDNEQHSSRRIVVAGVAGAGGIAAATTALAGSTVRELVTDLAGFRFAKLDNVWDVNFMPGAEKYGDIPALLALCSAKTTILGEKEPVRPEAMANAIIQKN